MASSSQERAIVRWGVANEQLTSGQRWMTFLCMFFFALVTMFDMLKCSPVLMIIGEQYGMGLDSVGNIMSLFNIAGIIMSFPAIWVMRNLGVKFSLIVTGIITLLGSLIGVYATDAGMFLFSRVLEGAGMGMVAAIGPNVIPRLFPANKLGFAMGFWSIWTSPGILLATLVGPQIFVMTGTTTSLWWFSIVLEIIAIVWMLLCFKMNKKNENQIAAETLGGKDVPGIKRNFVLSATVASLSFLGYAMAFGMFQNFYPTYLQDAAGLDVVSSAFPSTITVLVTMPISLVIGIIIDRYNLRKTTLIAGHLILAFTMGWFAWLGAGSMMIAAGVLVGLVQGILPVALRLIIPMQVTDPRKMDYILGIMAFVTNIGSFYSGPFGALVASVGWESAGLMGLLPVELCFAILCLVLVKGDKKVLASGTPDGNLEETKMPGAQDK